MSKETSRKEKASKNIMFGIFSKMVNIVFPFIVRTVLIYKLGMEYAGISSLFSSILSVLSLTELGFGTALVYSMYKPVAENNKVKLCEILNLYKAVYRIIGILIALIGIFIIPFIPKLVTGEVPADINLTIVYLFFLINTVSSYLLFSYKQSLLSAYMKDDINNVIRLIVYLFLYIGQIIMLIITDNYYAYILVLPISTVLNNVLTELYTKKNMPDIYCKGNLPASEKKAIFKNVFALAGHRFGDVLTSSFDNIIISSVLGLQILAIFSNYFYIYTAVISCFSVFDQVLIPIIGNCIVKDSRDQNYQRLLNLQFIYVWIVGWCTVCFLCLYQDAITIWVGEQYTISFFEMVLFVIYFLSWKINSIVALFKNASGLWLEDKYRPYYSSIINLALNIILVKCIGMSGVLLSTIIVLTFITIPVENKVTFKSYFKRKSTEYYSKMFTYLFVIFISSFVTYLLCSKIILPPLSSIFIKIILCFLIPNVIYLLFFHKTKEFEYVISLLKGGLKK